MLEVEGRGHTLVQVYAVEGIHVDTGASMSFLLYYVAITFDAHIWQ